MQKEHRGSAASLVEVVGHSNSFYIGSSEEGDIDEDKLASPGRKNPRFYEVWPGKNRPCCFGRFLCGPNPIFLTFTFLLIFIHSGLYAYFTARRIHFTVIIFEVLIMVFTLYMLFATAFTEPGILPRVAEGTFCPHKKNPFVNAPVVQVGGKEVKLAYCTTCHVYRPPRTKHCRQCDNCVEEFDHHCEFVSNDIGKRNYRYFFLFVISAAFLDAFVFFSSVGLLIYEFVTRNIEHVVKDVNNILTLYLVIVTLAASGVCGLCKFHCWLVSIQTTTNEYIKGYFGGVQPAQDTLFCENLWNLLVRPLHKTKVPLQERVNDENFLDSAYDANIPTRTDYRETNASSFFSNDLSTRTIKNSRLSSSLLGTPVSSLTSTQRMPDSRDSSAVAGLSAPQAASVTSVGSGVDVV